MVFFLRFSCRWLGEIKMDTFEDEKKNGQWSRRLRKFGVIAVKIFLRVWWLLLETEMLFGYLPSNINEEKNDVLVSVIMFTTFLVFHSITVWFFFSWHTFYILLWLSTIDMWLESALDPYWAKFTVMVQCLNNSY